MSLFLVFSAGSFRFGIPAGKVDHIKNNDADVDLSGYHVQNVHSLFNIHADRESAVQCWIIQKDGNALGVNQIQSFGEVETFEIPPFLKQNLTVSAIDGLGRFNSDIIFLLSNRGEGHEELC